MIAALLILLVTATLSAASGATPRLRRWARVVAPGGVAVALAVGIWQEGLNNSTDALASGPLAWPSWLGRSPYMSDPLSAGMGSWCLLLGLLLLLELGSRERGSLQAALVVLTLADLYSLVHLDNVLAFGWHMLALVLLAWANSTLVESRDNSGVERQRLAMGAGSLLVLSAALLIGRTTGGDYSLPTLSPGVLTVWPVVLLGGGILLWLGSVPCVGWSGRGHAGLYRVVVQTLVIGVPVLALLLRLEAALTNEALAGTVPVQWTALTGTLQWLGALTALAAGAGCLVWAGLPRWSAMLTAYILGLMLWAVSLDTPGGRLAAVAILVSYGASSVGAEIAASTNSDRDPLGNPVLTRLPYAICMLSRMQVPLTGGFVGLWLLSGALGETRHPALALVALAAALLAACGGVMHGAIGEERDEVGFAVESRPPVQLAWLGAAIAAVILIGGAFPSLWLPRAEAISGVAGGAIATPSTAASPPGAGAGWQGLVLGGAVLPVGWLAIGALLLTLILLLVRVGVAQGQQARFPSPGVLLPTTLGRPDIPGEESRVPQSSPIAGMLANPPSPVWWLSLAWLDAGVWGTGIVIGRFLGRTGLLLRLAERRLYLPLLLGVLLFILLSSAR